MPSRLDLQTELETLLGSRNVYYRPPASIRMNYPAIRYNLDKYDTVYADNRAYRNTRRYSGVVIDRDPDSTIAENILAHFPMCSLDEPYVADNLNHFPFTLYY